MAQKLQSQPEPAAAERRSRPTEHTDRRVESPQEIERRVVVPLVDELPQGRVVYDHSIATLAIVGGVGGAVVLGLLAWMIASGLWAPRDLGQFAAGGPTVAIVTGTGIGVAVGALVGALIAVYRLPAHRMD